jgi:nitric oxide reductase subunit B
MERVMKVDFGQVQNDLQVHFFVLIIGATILTTGLTLYIMDFLKYGMPNDEALES